MPRYMIIYSIITTNNNQYYSVMFGANNKRTVCT